MFKPSEKSTHNLLIFLIMGFYYIESTLQTIHPCRESQSVGALALLPALLSNNMNFVELVFFFETCPPYGALAVKAIKEGGVKQLNIRGGRQILFCSSLQLPHLHL